MQANFQHRLLLITFLFYIHNTWFIFDIVAYKADHRPLSLSASHICLQNHWHQTMHFSYTSLSSSDLFPNPSLSSYLSLFSTKAYPLCMPLAPPLYTGQHYLYHWHFFPGLVTYQPLFSLFFHLSHSFPPPFPTFTTILPTFSLSCSEIMGIEAKDKEWKTEIERIKNKFVFLLFIPVGLYCRVYAFLVGYVFPGRI